MHLVLNEVIGQWDNGSKERSSKDLSILQCPVISPTRTQGNAACRPWNRSNEVGNHKDVMPVMIIRRCNVCPSTTAECSKEADAGDEFWEGAAALGCHAVPEGDEGKSWT